MLSTLDGINSKPKKYNFEIIKELVKIRIPEAIWAVEKSRVKANNMWITGAIVSAGGQFFREVASNWFIEDFKDITYQRILGMGSRYFGGF